ncbi:hypothetical protein APR41_07225 [Salegentibacter salinarum]|uniref:Methyltransferase type 11 n=1 Tax=Salegentibacter salinarum TaxID=447422 RepID=A0A2N0TR46_9FLAO|nr:hypothetical protein [Salegentibacter salinarum]PKD17213.1 hypothetical protein APR41_07225 [Salegentibacter salinarum]SKB56486.1 hypothetical protein SAMN05660903_01471 [Salegentibacter salinarum]
MVRVFKTNITDTNLADEFIDSIHLNFSNYIANFDLEDCDNILRIESFNNEICRDSIINLLAEKGFYAEELPD